MPWGATTSRTRSSSPSASSRTTSSPRSTSRSSSASPATPSSARKRSPATSRTSARRPSRTSTSRASCASAPRSSRRHPRRQDHAEGRDPALPRGEAAARDLRREGRRRARQLAAVPPGVSGIVINARVFSRKGTEKDERAQAIEDAEREKLEKDSATRGQDHLATLLQQDARAARRQDHRGQARRRQGQGPARQGPEDHDERSTSPAQVLGRDPGRRGRRQGRGEARAARRRARGGRHEIESTTARRSPSSPRATSCRRASSRW
jgi:hypothetical protein